MPDPYFSELKYLGNRDLDFIEVAVDAGLDVSNIQVIVYNPNGSIRSTNNLGSVTDTVAGRDVYVIDTLTSGTFNGLNKNGAAALVVDGNVTSFLSFENTVNATTGPAAGTSSSPLGATDAGESFETSDNGGTYDVQDTPTSGTVPCFLRGTPILTPRGARAVEALRASDLVWTEDAGFQPVIWTGTRTLSLSHGTDETGRPVRIPAGSFGPGAPARDIYVSPNHRIMITHPLCAIYFGTPEILAPAKALMGRRGIGHAPVPLPISYHHLLLARHAILRADGLACESFDPGTIGLAAFGADAARQIAALLPHADPLRGTYGPTARLVAKPSEIAMLMDAVGDDPLDIAVQTQPQRAA